MKVISFDGGGIRGYLTAIICAEIERKTGKKITTLFDEFYGTSTGSILAVALASGRFTAIELVEMYESKRFKIFKKNSSIFAKLRLGKSKYNIENLQSVLKDELNGLKMSHLVRPVHVGVYDLARTRATIISNEILSWYDGKGFEQSIDFDCFCWESISASSSVISYFDSVKINHENETYNFVDGGHCGLNNMADIASQKLKKGDLLLSLGTGTHESSLVKSSNRLAFSGANFLNLILHPMLDGGSEKSTAEARKRSIDNEFEFVRIQKKISKHNSSFDNISESNMNALKAYALQRTQETDFIQLIDTLKK